MIVEIGRADSEKQRCRFLRHVREATQPAMDGAVALEKLARCMDAFEARRGVDARIIGTRKGAKAALEEGLGERPVPSQRLEDGQAVLRLVEQRRSMLEAGEFLA
jgi:hypothetical protein